MVNLHNLKKYSGTEIITTDNLLEQYRNAFTHRWSRLISCVTELEESFGSLENASLGHKFFGFNYSTQDGQPGLFYREWAPNAIKVFLTGDFNNWSRSSHPLVKDKNGVWSIFIPENEYINTLPHSRIKTHVLTLQGSKDRLPAYLMDIELDENSKTFYGLLPSQVRFKFKHSAPAKPKSLRIYEAHVGMAGEEAKVSSFQEFQSNVLPRVKDLGYNTIQLMAIAQHPYYGSFGYQISNLFSVSHYFGSKDELKELIDTAHGMGIYVLLDIVHSHMVKNTQEGLNLFDGSEYQYFHKGPKGNHPAWDTKLFDYSKPEVLRLLLSNVRYWLEDFKFDGFRFDGVTSMLYHHHGLNTDFNHYDNYFGADVDLDSLIYLQLANLLIHELNPNSVTIAEEVSGMPGLALPVTDGGVGFDYRLSMGIPDYWIKILKHLPDENWDMDQIYNVMLERRHQEKHIAYAESHDQALVGDKTIAFRLMDKDMYFHMRKDLRNEIIDRGLALHKLIRLVTFSLGGEGWMNFMGNEFGHPEWIDFPREGNNYSFDKARRQWSLADNPDLCFEYLLKFDKAMQNLDQQHQLLADPFIQKITANNQEKVLAFRRGPLVFAFNFHPSQSYSDYRLGVPDPIDYQLELSSDIPEFGGFDRIKANQIYIYQSQSHHHREQSIQVYLPSRTAIVLKPSKA